MTGVVERNLSQSHILEGIQDKNTVVPKDFFDDFDFYGEKPRKTGGLVYVPPEKTKTETTLSF